MFLAFGVAFEVPIVVVVLVRMGFVSIEKLKEFRGYFIVVAFIVAAIITPPDVVSQLALAIPMCLLYEVGIWAAQLFIKHTKAPEESADAAADLSVLTCSSPLLRRALGRRSGRRPGVTFSSTVSSRALHAELRRLPGLESRPRSDSSSDTLAICLLADFHDDVAGTDAGLRGRAVLQHAGDQHAAFGLDAESLHQFRRQVGRLDADPAAP